MAKEKKKLAPSTQQHLDIAEIRDDLVILKDGTVRSVMMVSSINFALKSEDEQEAIIQAYITFLNGLEHSIQIVIHSRKMNIDSYLDSLHKQQRETGNDLLRSQIADYTDFVSELVEMGEIMQKRFYMIVPYDPLSNKRKGFFARVRDVLSPTSAAKLNQKQILERQEQLTRRTEILSGQLASMGLNTVRLDTQGLIELYFTVYNPDIFGKEKLADLTKVRYEE
ncbi:MAG: hypothetical protein UU08_C0002G0011 [Candidatus Uhrbacteria bacterium GW2011_GWE2_40_58]|nr:MAG: hypothetical protein UT94_C0048G0004 [Candidatus Uhrbacteria bacterium GW2011_GWF2_40_263]KKR68160.1 MAG: hypothetical protein UU08_C0002G0011 [Candidatus Uhrbacteria bacterium GW2011_GWE2_40_58]OGL91849.1 MAG: hypothetical protein A2239_01500 [Candidatus Uhrbacteria bacterium RIFOXYA2_FULL_40_9]OGL97682.1 MAG: hypothetical protein A2332_00860 [Candidatus Uhrbacteria bacterium RIFOXYB2_FULL_41_18]HBK34697.1 hypothetical protein [Candidatus Uhrbacteria bacterium]